jgi:DNA-directed RNA polymerase subunit RPC12/RpoP
MKITAEMQAKYLASGGNECPYCDGPVEADRGVEVDAGIAWQNVKCNRCGAEWIDEYKLVGISAADELASSEWTAEQILRQEG